MTMGGKTLSDGRYDKLIEGLNEAQRAAVMHGAASGDEGSGPLIVLAGPGTGKTRVIVHRIARLLADGAEPESIVAVTFTNKAAAQLRERLAGIVGSAAASGIRAQTFHALGLWLVRRYAGELGLPPIRQDAAILDSAQRIRLVREAILSQGLFAGRRAEALDTHAERVMAGIRVMSNYAIEPEAATAFIETWRERIRAGTDSSGHEVDEVELKAESARLEEFVDIARAYAWYSRECRRRGWLGFEDLIGLSIRLLRDVPRAAAIVRGEFRHALVDEFQDVNAGQIELLRQLFPTGQDASAAGPDLCIVGDDDQAIYGFRGSDDRAFERFDRLWPGSRRILLTENYRSQPPIIAAANRVISLASERFAPDKQVVPAVSLRGEGSAPGAGVECIELGNDREDGGAIATAILLDRAAGPVPLRPWSAYAVVCRTNGDIARVVGDLELEGIPARGSYGDDLSQDAGVQDVLAWIELLSNPREQWPVRRLLTRPPIAVDPLVAMEYEKRFGKENRLRESGAGEAPIYLDWLRRAAATDSAAGPAVERLCALHAGLSAVAANGTAPEAIEQIIMQTDAAHADLLPARPRAKRVSALLALVRLARLALPRLDQPRDLREFRRYWHDLDADDQSLREVGGADERLGETGTEEDSQGSAPVVTVISAHKAKGLEWDTVFVPRVTPVHGYGKAGRSEPGVVPAGLLGESGDAAAAQAAEERRIFYVACTRAERRLVLLAKRNKKPSGSTHYFEEFTRNPEGQRLVRVEDVADLRRRAAAALGRDDLGTADEAGHGELAGEALDRARLMARLAAAEALEFADRADAGAADVEAAAKRLHAAAARLAVVSHIARHRAAPAWISGDPALTEFAARLVEVASRRDRPVMDAPRAPLHLSYTAIDHYHRCPRCYWLRYVKGLPETQRRQTVLGTVVHKALERFYDDVREAESAGLEPPGLDRLLRIGRDTFAAAWPEGAEIDRSELEQSLAQLEVAHTAFHDPGSQVLEIEKKIEWEYVVPAAGPGEKETRHRFEAKLDRLDQATLADGRAGFRIIDYKTGKDWKKLTEPAADDLQFGVYALALPHLLPDVDPADVVAEYWILSSGTRGVIPLSNLKMEKIRKKIDDAVRGILAGEFEPARGCEGDCRLLGVSLGGG